MFGLASSLVLITVPLSRGLEIPGDTDHHLYPVLLASLLGVAVVWFIVIRVLLRTSAEKPRSVSGDVVYDGASEAVAGSEVPSVERKQHALMARLIEAGDVGLEAHDRRLLSKSRTSGNPRVLIWEVSEQLRVDMA